MADKVIIDGEEYVRATHVGFDNVIARERMVHLEKINPKKNVVVLDGFSGREFLEKNDGSFNFYLIVKCPNQTTAKYLEQCVVGLVEGKREKDKKRHRRIIKTHDEGEDMIFVQDMVDEGNGEYKPAGFAQKTFNTVDEAKSYIERRGHVLHSIIDIVLPSSEALKMSEQAKANVSRDDEDEEEEAKAEAEERKPEETDGGGHFETERVMEFQLKPRPKLTKMKVKADFVSTASDDEILQIDPSLVEYCDDDDMFRECPCFNDKGRGSECGYRGKDCDNYDMSRGTLPCEKFTDYMTTQIREEIERRKARILAARANNND